MYDVYLVSAASDVAGKVEFRKTGDGEAKAVPELTVPAYGKLTMGPDGVHLLLVELKRPLQEDESVPLTLTTDGNVKLWHPGCCTEGVNPPCGAAGRVVASISRK